MTTSGHRSRTKLEAAVCTEMERQKLPHEHRSLKFRVRDADGKETAYVPAIAARRGPILFLVEPLRSVRRQEEIASFSGFLEQHSPDIVFVVIAPDFLMDKVPLEAYDEIYGESGIGTMTARIRKQDPKGIVRPFEKRRPHDTTK